VHKLSWFRYALVFCCVPVLAQNIGTVSVSGQANIFGAGLGFPPGGGATPSSISFPASPGQVITFPSVTGGAALPSACRSTLLRM